MKKKIMTPVLIVGIALALLAILLVVLKRPAPEPLPAEAPLTARAETPAPTVRIREVEKLVEVEKEITAEILQDGLNEIGVLLTEEYYFTEVISYSSVKSLLHLDLAITESRYLASYDGLLTAGIDFTGIRVEKDEEKKEILVSIPLPTVLSVDIDPESFVLYDEKQGLGNRISVTDFNQSLIELEQNAEEKAVDRGVLERAAENAQTIIKNFIVSLLGETDYTLRFMPLQG